MKLAIIVEAIPPYCGGAEQVAWIHAVQLAKQHDVSVVTFGDSLSKATRDGVDIYYLPFRKRSLLDYSTRSKALLSKCLDEIEPSVIHCHMPNVVCACLNKKERLLVSTIHDGVPENELRRFRVHGWARWLRWKFVRRVNIRKSDLVTCVSLHNLDVMRSLYRSQLEKFSFIPNPIAERLFTPIRKEDDGFVLNFGRQIPLKMAALLEVAKVMPGTRFVFVGTGEMVRDHGLPNVEFVGFSAAVEDYIDRARVCVFPSLSENFPLVGLEAMARGKPVIATRRGFSEYIEHMKNGFLLDSTEPSSLKTAIELFLTRTDLCELIGQAARKTAELYHPSHIVEQYLQLYQHALANSGMEAESHS
jgi:glycosyltransferase involved in cell wall biosynthesis